MLVWEIDRNIIRKAGLEDLSEIIYALLQLIPLGKVSTYNSMARILGVSPRLVGLILHRNKQLIKIPCHRIVKSDLTLGGYSKGIEFKKQLLKLEGVGMLNNRVKKEHLYLYEKELLNT